jgi:hypothetical protein
LSRVCVACGLAVDVDGNLVVATSGTAGDAAPITSTCTVASGTHIYCDPTSGKLYGEPEKFFRMRRFGKNLVPDDPIDVHTLAPTDNNNHIVGTPAVLAFTNPSDCRPMNFLVESGISHCRLDHSAGGDFEVEVQTTLGITGAVSLADTGTGHQIWRFKSDSVLEAAAFDSMGARSYLDTMVIPPGGTITLYLKGFIRITAADATCTIQNWTVDVIYTAWHD